MAAAKAPGDVKAPDQPVSTPGQMSTPGEAEKQQKNLEQDKPITNVEETGIKDAKPAAKKGIQESTPTITAKDEKRDSQKSRYYEVSISVSCLVLFICNESG